MRASNPLASKQKPAEEVSPQRDSVHSLFSKPEHRTFLSTEQAAAYLCLRPSTLCVWRSTGRYSIPFVKIGSHVRYRQADLDAWLEERTRITGSTE
jgi:excisionase family DNA binding protein